MFRIAALTASCICTGLLTGCALTPEEPAPVVAPAPLVQTEDEPSTSHAPVLVLPPASRPAVHVTGAKSATSKARRPEVLPVKFVEQAMSAGIGPVATPVRAPATDNLTKAQSGPAWLKGCQHRQQQGNVIMCDADVLLAQPSDKVMVYARDAKLSRKSSDGGSIALRESLPFTYRFFVLE